MPHNWPPPGGVDPLLSIETPLNAAMRRVVDAPVSYRFFKEVTITKTAFEDPDGTVLDPDHEIVFNDPPPSVPTGIENNFESSRVRVVNDGPETIEYSYDGVNVHGKLSSGEAATDDERRERRIFIRKVGGANANVRIWAW
jgi:hypothetical protein